MLPTRYRRLWRRRLRRRPLLPFLLLATLAVDLALLFASSGDLNNPFLGGLLGGQIALLAVWVTHQRRGSLARVFVSLVILLVAIHCTFGLPLDVGVESAESGFEDDFFFGLDLRPVFFAVLSAMAALATLTAWAIRSICTLMSRSTRSQRRVRFQISSLLWATLIAVVLLSFGRNGDWSELLKAEVLTPILLFELTPLTALLPIALLTGRNSERALWLVGAPCLALLLCLSFWADGYLAYFSSHTAFLGVWLYLSSDRGPAPETQTVQKLIDPPPASIDLRA